MGTSKGGRWPHAGPDQLPLLFASLAVAVGSFLPWIVIGSDLQMSGARGGGLWTFYAANLGIAGALVRRPQLAAAGAATAGAVAVGVGTWQILHLIGRVGLDGWRPGFGLVVVMVGGTIALRSAWRLGVTAGPDRAQAGAGSSG